MSYSDKAEIFGSFIELTHYEKPINEIPLFQSKFKRRTIDLFKKRRLDNVLRAKRVFVRRVQTVLAGRNPPLFVTLTFADKNFDFLYGAECMRKFLRHVQKVYSGTCYVFVPELHESGAIHYHCFLWGLPETMGDIFQGRRRIAIGTERSTRFLAQLWGKGFVDCKRTDGSEKLASYLGKYMIKASMQLPQGVRSYTFSKNFPKTQVLKGTGDNISKMFESSTPVFENSYRTSWLGTITKKVYRLKHEQTRTALV